MESEFEIPGHSSDYCITLISEQRLLALLLSPIICVFKKHRCVTCHHYCGFSVCFYFQYWLSKISGRIFLTVLCYLQFLSAVVTEGPKQPYIVSGSFLKCITMHQTILVDSKSIILKAERHSAIDEHVGKGSWWIQNKVNKLLNSESRFESCSFFSKYFKLLL